MVKRIFLHLLFLFLLTGSLWSQDTISLPDCYKAMEAVHPFGLEPEVYNQVLQLNQRIDNTNYLPKLTLNAKATYQSDVVKLDINIPSIDIPSPSKDQYGASVDVNQVIYDGGTTKALKELHQAEYNTNLQKVSVELYQVKKQINQLYFSVLILEKNKASIGVSIDNLNERIKIVNEQVDNGVLLNTNLLVLQSQKIKLEQNIDELSAMLKSAKEALGILIGRSSESILLTEPVATDGENSIRPELQLFQVQKEQLNKAGKLTATERMPKLAGFGQFGYGKPGLNMLNDKFDTYYIVGAKLTWNIWDWNQVKYKRQSFNVQHDLIDISEKAFLQGQQTELTKVSNTILQLETAVEKDDQLVTIQKKILENYAAQVENGVITTTEYVNQLNEVLLAEIKLNTHKIKLIQAKTDENTIQGKI